MATELKSESDAQRPVKAPSSQDRPLTASEQQELIAIEPANERRRHARATFRGLQRIAPFSEGRFPPSNAFRQVSCHGISSGGFSFFQSEPPLEREFVVALTIGGTVKCFKARVIHAQATYTDEGLKFLVGCAFAGRIEPR
jgi:hypothetical protein